MRTIAKLASCFTLLVISATCIRAQDAPNERDPRWQQLAQAYGFLASKDLALRTIASEFPDLSQQIRKAQFAFDSSALGAGGRAIEPAIKEEVGAKWPETKEALLKTQRDLIEKQRRRRLTRADATRILAEIEGYGKGEMPVKIRDTLLAVNPAYVKSPGAELSAGWRLDFSTKPHPKADGANVSIGFPASWRKRESARASILQVFRSGAGHGPLMCNVIAFKILDDEDGDLTPDDMQQLFTKEFLKENVPEGVRLLDSRVVKIAGAPGGMIVTDLTEENLDVKVKMRSTTFLLAHKQHMIHVNFLIFEQKLQGMTLDEAQKAYFPTYRTIMSTLVRHED